VTFLCDDFSKEQSRTPLIRINLGEGESYPDIQKIRIIRFFFENRVIGSLNFGFYYFQYVFAPKPFDHAGFEVLEAITLSCT